jgi:hypothetical protein
MRAMVQAIRVTPAKAVRKGNDELRPSEMEPKKYGDSLEEPPRCVH